MRKSSRLWLSSLALIICFTNAVGQNFELNGNAGVTVVPDGIPPATTILYLKDNHIISVQESDLAHILSLQELYLSGNELSQVPALTFSAASITDLSLASNDINTTSADDWFYYDSLQDLSMQYNSLTLFPDLQFVGDTLQEIRLDHNEITTVSESDFSGLDVLTWIDLSYNGLAVFPSLVHVEDTLTHFYFDHNPLGNISADLLDGLVNITSTSFYDMGLHEMPTLGHLCTNMYHLNLQYNNISSMNPEDLEHCDIVIDIDFERNPFISFPNLTFVGDTLERLHIDNGQLVQVEQELLAELQVLDYLKLDDNFINHFPNVTCLGNTLETLYLRNNRISVVEVEILDKLVVLEQLWLDENYLTTFPDASGPLLIERIRLGFNRLDSFPQLDWIGRSLKILRLEGNSNITVITKMNLEPLVSLVDLYVYGTSISSVPDISPIIGTIEDLRLSTYNYPTAITDVHFKTASLLGTIKDLQFMESQVSILPSICPRSSGVTLNFQESPLDLCDCDMLWLKQAKQDGLNVLVTDVFCSNIDKMWTDATLTELADGCYEPMYAGCKKGMLLGLAIPDYFCPFPPGPLYEDVTSKDCMRWCLQMTSCRSFNFRPYVGNGTIGSCMLVAITETPTDTVPLVGLAGWTHYTAKSFSHQCP